MSSAAFDTATWLGVEILGVTGKPINLGARVRSSFKAIAEDGSFTEDDVPEDGAKLNNVQLKAKRCIKSECKPRKERTARFVGRKQRSGKSGSTSGGRM